MPKVSFYTLGCKVNQAETEAMLRAFSEAGFEYVNFSERADIYIINTCTVTREADRKSRQMIRRATKRKGNGVVVVTGCYAEISPQEITKIPGVDLIIPQSDKPLLLDSPLDFARDSLEEYSIVFESLDCARDKLRREPSPSRTTPRLTTHHALPIPRLHTRAFLKVQDGCDSFCSYCIVPFARGRPRSEPPDKIVRRVKELAEEGAQEIVLTGVHLGKYGKELPDRPGLVDLLKEIISIPKMGRIRLSSLEPEEINPELIDLITQHSRILKNTRMLGICRHLHIPLQSGDDAILKKMGRKYTASHYEDIVIELKRQVPGIAITTDVMVGFPSESEKQFEKTLDLVERLGLAKLHVFRYSSRKGTKAAAFSDQIPEDVKTRRSEILLQLDDGLRKRFRQQFLGQVLEVLVEQRVDGKLTGLTDNYLRAYFDGEDDLIGRLVDIPFAEWYKETN